MKPAVLVALLMTGCSIRQLTIDTTADLVDEGSRAFDAEADVEIARSAAPGQIKQLEGLLVPAPRHRTLLAMAARALLEYTFGFVEEDLESLPEGDGAARRATIARATALYDRAFLYAVRHLETFDPRIRAAIAEGGARLEAAVTKLPKEALPGLAYGGMALASSVNINRGDPARVADLPRARALVERAYALDPKFYLGGPAMVLGMLAAQRGERERARAYFEEAIAVSGGKYLLPRVMRARTLLGEKAQEKELEGILAEPHDIYPEARLANEMARRRAERSLAKFR